MVGKGPDLGRGSCRPEGVLSPSKPPTVLEVETENETRETPTEINTVHLCRKIPSGLNHRNFLDLCVFELGHSCTQVFVLEQNTTKDVPNFEPHWEGSEYILSRAN